MDFLRTVKSGHHEAVREALKTKTVDLDYQDEGTLDSALHMAVTIKRCKMKVIDLLIGAGADCELRNGQGLTPAELALECGYQNVAEFMLQQELKELPDEDAFLRLVRRGSVELLQIFLEKRGFDIHTKMKLVAGTVDELAAKGVRIAEKMRVYLEYELVAYNYRYCLGGSTTAGGCTKRKTDGSRGATDTEADRRVELLLQCTKYLNDHYDGDNLNDLDDRFVLRLRTICECLFFLDDAERHRERKLFRGVPITEITYLVGVFLAILEKHVGFEIYKLVINKNMVMSYLNAVCAELTASLVQADRSSQWSAQLLLDLITCIREQKLLQYVGRRKRESPALQRITADQAIELSTADQELLHAEMRRKEFLTLQEGVLEHDGKWCATDYVVYLRCDHRTIAQLWQQRHPKLRLTKRQVVYVASRRELLKIRARRLTDLSRNKMKLLEKELNAREFQSLGRTVRRRNQIVFRLLRKSYEQIRRMHTVKKIAYYVENAIVIDLDDPSHETLCLMAIKRVLHMVTESIRSSDQVAFGKMLQNVLDHVLASVECSDKNRDLHDAFSHRYPLAKYFINKTMDVNQYKQIQNSLRSVYRFFLYVINIQLIEAYKTFLGTAYRLTNLGQLNSYAKYVGEHNLHTLSHIKFDHVFYDEDETAKIIYELKKMYIGMSNELKLLSFIEKNIHFRFYHMQYHQTRLRVTLANFAVVYRALKANPEYGSIKRLLYSYLHQSYQKYDISKSISISDSSLALKELLRPYNSISENEEALTVVKHLEQLQNLMDPDRLFGINPVRHRAPLAEGCKYHQFTRKVLKEMNLQLNDEDFQQLHEKLRRTYYENIFLLQNRYRVMQEFFRNRDIQIDSKVLAGFRERDEELLQELFDSKVNDLVEILEKFDCGGMPELSDMIGELPPFVQFALEFGLLELLEILSSVNVMSNNFGRLRWCTPVLSGRNLKTFLGAGSVTLVLDVLTYHSNATIFLNALVFKQQGFRLYGGGNNFQESLLEVPCCEAKFRQRLRWFEAQETLFEAARTFDLELLKAAISKGAEMGGKRLGPLVANELCHYNLIDRVIVEDFLAMIDMLNGDFARVDAKRKRMLEFLLRRTINSHFMVGQFLQLRDEDRRMLVLYLSMFLGNVDVFSRNLKRYDAHDDLHLFVNSENHGFVVELISRMQGFDWNKTDSSGMTILHKVVNAGNVQAAQCLARVPGVDLNISCNLKYTAVNLAARLNLTAIVRILEEAKANVNMMSEDEKLPVFWLIQYRNPKEIVRLGINQVTELTSFSSELCLLHKSIEYNNLDVVRYLIEDRKVDPTRIYSNCNNVLHAAASFNRTAILQYLLSLAGIRKILNNCNLVKNTPLNIACKERHFRSAKMLLENGSHTDPSGEYGLNALAFAMYTNSFKLVKLLFHYGATISYALSSDFQPINMAIINRNLPMLKFLLRNGVYINSAPLCFINAVYAQSRDIVKLLVTRQAKHVNFKDEFCQTALHLCVERDEYDLAKDLLRYGADINAKNRSGATPLHLAVAHGNVRFVQLLLDSKCAVDELNYHGETSLIKAVVCNNLDIVKILLNNGASIERLRNSDPPVLLYLVQENYEEILDYLLEHYQFNPNEQDAYGNALVYVATQHNHINIVKLLVDKYHAKTNPINHKKLTPLMIARVKEYKEIFDFLESRLIEE